MTDGMHSLAPAEPTCPHRGHALLPPTDVMIILPVLNEIACIGPMLQGIGRELASTRHLICLIDDGSTDGTVPRIQAAMRRNPRIHLIQRKKTQRGSQRGSALKAGMEWGLRESDCQIYVEMDGDLSHRPEELRTGIALVAGGHCDVAIASKYLPGSRVLNRQFGRQLVSRLCSLVVGNVISPSIKDYSNGYRFYHSRAAKLISTHQIFYGSPIYLTEVLALWLKQGLRVLEFPSTYVGRHEGLSKLRPIDLFKAALAVAEIGWRFHLKGFCPVPAGFLSAPQPTHQPDLSTVPKAA